MTISRRHLLKTLGIGGLSLALTALPFVRPAGFASLRVTDSMPRTGARAFAMPFAPLAASIVVNTTGDGDNVDANVGCDADAVAPGEQCTLRAAIQRANALAGDDEIGFNIPTSEPNCNAMTGACIINLTKVLPDVSTNVVINGPGPDKLTVRRNTGGDYRIFNVTGGSTVTFSGLTINNGVATNFGSFGGGIQNFGTANIINCAISGNNGANSAGGAGIANGGTLNITGSEIAGNVSSVGGFGGGINNSGTLTVTNSTIRDNSALKGGGILNSGTANVTGSTININTAGDSGGGIHNIFPGTLTILNSKIGKNSVTKTLGKGGGIYVESGEASVTNSVIHENLATAANSGGGGIFNEAGTLNVSNSTIALNDSAFSSGRGITGSARVKSTIIALNGTNRGIITADVAGSHTSEGFNFIGKRNDATSYTQPTDQTGTNGVPLDPAFDPAGFPNGNFIPFCGSPVIDKGTSAALTGPLTTDVRGAGFPRTVDDPLLPNAAGGDGTDIGAFERPVCPQFTFTVNTTADADDVNPSDTACDSDAATAGPQCTLRAAISETNALGGTHAINFSIPTTDPGFDASGRHTINLTGALPDIVTHLTISGPGANKLTVRRNSGAAYSVFKATGRINPTTTIILEVVISGLTISNGIAAESDGGGGIRFANRGNLTVTDCVIADNFAVYRGGGISMPVMGGVPNLVQGTLNVTNCTFLRNFVSGSFNDSGGGGIFGNTMNVTNSVFSDNGVGIGARGGGISIDSASTTAANITNCTFTNNSAFGGGGGISVSGFPLGMSTTAVNITSSTFSNNETANGGGGGAIRNTQGRVNVVNTTINGNFTAEGVPGGGIFNGCDDANLPCNLNITNSTISGNRAGIGGGLRVEAGVVQVKSSIIALNTRVTNTGSAPISDVFGTVTSAGFNLIGSEDGSMGFTQPTDQKGTTASPLDPKLDPAGLQNNGGPTQTIALQPTSPAIDKGTANGLTGALTTDQRGAGFTRTFDDPAITNAADGTDIGAFERNPTAPTPTPTPTVTPTPTPSPTPTPTTPTFQFDASAYTVDESCTAVTVRVLRTGPTGVSAAVDITSEDGTARQKGDYNFVTGQLTFAPGETEKILQVLVNDDSYPEGFEFATLILQHPVDGTLGGQSTAMLQIMDNASETSTNPIDNARGFVCQHYHDFLYRQSDQAGEDFWTTQLEQCGTDAPCLKLKRTDVSTAFFISIEFQQTGYFVIRAHKAAFGNLKSNPRYAAFLSDQRHLGEGVVVGQGNWQLQLATNKQNYLADFVSRAEFVAVFPQGQAAAAYVDGLFTNAGVAPTASERNAAITAYGSGDTAGRAAALQSIIESGTVFNALYNPAFVLMQYYGYLRRNPDDLPDNNFNGYDFWLAKMNSFTLPGEDARIAEVALARVRRAEMVKAFIESSEYRERFFGSTTGNQQGLEVIGMRTTDAENWSKAGQQKQDVTPVRIF
jgi:CSLREA domain-containing protein